MQTSYFLIFNKHLLQIKRINCIISFYAKKIVTFKRILKYCFLLFQIEIEAIFSLNPDLVDMDSGKTASLTKVSKLNCNNLFSLSLNETLVISYTWQVILSRSLWICCFTHMLSSSYFGSSAVLCLPEKQVQFVVLLSLLGNKHFALPNLFILYDSLD